MGNVFRIGKMIIQGNYFFARRFGCVVAARRSVKEIMGLEVRKGRGMTVERVRPIETARRRTEIVVCDIAKKSIETSRQKV